MKITTRRIVLVLVTLVLLVLVIMMVTGRPAGAESNSPTMRLISQAGGIGMLAFVYSIGGFFVGGGTVYIYAKATDQTIEWRGVPGISWILRQRDSHKKEEAD